jgi:hypothetical protein
MGTTNMKVNEIPWTRYEECSHVIIGYHKDNLDGGILATAKDEFTAHRYARGIRWEYPDARVEKYDDSTCKNVSKELTSMFF